MHSPLVTGYLLHHTPFSDSRKRLDLFTAEQGRTTALVRLSKKNAPLVLFQPYILAWQGKTHLKTLIHYESSGLAPALNGTALYCGLYMNEILQRLLPSMEDATVLFSLYQHSLNQLAAGQAPEPSLRLFELALLRHIGYEYSFSHEGFSPFPIQANCYYHFSPHQGFKPWLNAPQSPLPPLVFKGSDILACNPQALDATALSLLKKICRTALAARLGRTPIKSRELFVNI